MDGKTARGSRTDTQAAPHLLAAVTGPGHTVTQLRVPTKTNEVTGFARLLAPFDLTGVTVTGDALHTQRDHARHLVEDKNAHYLLLVKGNQPRLHAALRSLPWSQVRARRYDRERGHGRRETRPKEFEPLPKWWVIERNFGWLMQRSRLARDYEAPPSEIEGDDPVGHG